MEAGSYFCMEEVENLRSQFNAMLMLKITHDAGFDICSNPIIYLCDNYNYYDCSESVFYDCITRIFGSYEIDEDEYENFGGEILTLTLPSTEIKELKTLLSPDEESSLIVIITQMMNFDSQHWGEMSGEITSDGLVIKLNGLHESKFDFLKQLIKIRKAIQESIDSQKEKLVQRLRNVLLNKIDQELQSTITDTEIHSEVNSLQDQVRIVSISSSVTRQDAFLSNQKTKNNRETGEVA